MCRTGFVLAPGLCALAACIGAQTAGRAAEPPPWEGSQAGIGEEVLPPWTPLDAEGTEARVWGRMVRWADAPFPAEIETAGQGVLAEPIRLLATIDGEETVVRGDMQPVGAWPHLAKWAAETSAGGVPISATAQIEYDGMMRMDLVLGARQGSTLDGLRLELPLRAEHAKYLYHFPGRWGSAFNAGALPEDGFVSGFRPFIWLGDEDRGLAWFCESDRNWAPLGAEDCVSIRREGDTVLLSLEIVSESLDLTEAIAYTFGLHPTPVKPVTEDVWDMRITHDGNYDLLKPRAGSNVTLSYPAEGNIELAQGTLEMWVRPEFDPNVEVVDGAGRGVHNRNLFQVKLANGDAVYLYWNIDVRGLRLFVREGDTYPVMLDATLPWQKGEFYNVAVTWGDEIAMYVDGEPVASKTHAGTTDQTLEGAEIVLGSATTEFTIDELHISNTVRDPAGLGQPATVDEATLLLDHLDETFEGDGQQMTRPAKAAERGDWTGGRVSTSGTFGPAKMGNGLLMYDPRGPAPRIDRLADLGVRTICFHEHWTSIQAYTSTDREDDLRQLVEACHERGIKLLLYFGYEMSNIAPEWETYSEECLVHPRRGGYTRNNPDQTAFVVCYGSHWQDFVAEGIARMMDELDIDGVYLDGTEYPWACANTQHGCGYERPDGTIGPTYSIFATREMMRRIYTIVRSRKPEGLVNVHNSTCMTTPTLAWATSTWDGEQFGGIEPGPHATEVLSLDAFRCEFMGRQWGVPAEFLCYNRPYSHSSTMCRCGAPQRTQADCCGSWTTSAERTPSSCPTGATAMWSLSSRQAGRPVSTAAGGMGRWSLCRTWARRRPRACCSSTCAPWACAEQRSAQTG